MFNPFQEDSDGDGYGDMCDECSFRLVEFPIYGLGRVGVAMPDINIDTDVPPTTTFTRYLNRKFYELTDHLGNVRAVLGDRKRTGSPGTGPYFGEIRSYSHVYPFGMPQPGRTWDSLSDYRYGYNGMETDGEVKEGSGKHYTTYFRQYDPRLGRWWSHDPVAQIGESPYAAMFNNPIGFSDPFGDCPTCPKNASEGDVHQGWVYTGGQWTQKTASGTVSAEEVFQNATAALNTSSPGYQAAKAGVQTALNTPPVRRTTAADDFQFQQQDVTADIVRPRPLSSPGSGYAPRTTPRQATMSDANAPAPDRRILVTDGMDFRQHSPFAGLGGNWTLFFRRVERGETNFIENFVYHANNSIWVLWLGNDYNLSGTPIDRQYRETAIVGFGTGVAVGAYVRFSPATTAAAESVPTGASILTQLEKRSGTVGVEHLEL